MPESQIVTAPKLPPGCEITATGMILPDEKMPVRQWRAIGPKLVALKEEYQAALTIVAWCYADWINYGARHYGETYAQAVLETGLSEHTLSNRCWTARKIESSRRREYPVTIEHHAAVAALPPPQQDALLDTVLDDQGQKQVSTRQLREQAEDSHATSNGKDPHVERARRYLENARAKVELIEDEQKRREVVHSCLLVPLGWIEEEK